MAKKGILVVSFGTTKDDTRRKTIEAVEQDIQAAYPGYAVRRAFTSGIVMKRLAERGVQVDDTRQALRRMADEGVDEVYIQPTHMMPGDEYDKFCAMANELRGEFAEMRIAKPLLYSPDDMIETAHALAKEYPVQEGEALLLTGHGTSHFANAVYPAMNYVFGSLGYKHVYVATVEGYPGIEGVLDEMKAGGYTGAVLAPFMLVAGDHAENDMAGDDEDSWKNLCLAHGIAPRCELKGMGEIAGVRAIYLRHIAECMQ